MRVNALNVNPFVRRLPVEGPASAHAEAPPVSDTARLTGAIVAGSEEAFREFHNAYFDRLRRYLLVIQQGDETAARDALQDTFVRVARYVRRFDSEPEFWGWLCAVARSAARDAGRKRFRYLAALKRFMFGQSPPVEPDAAGRNDLLELLEGALDELDPLDRRLIEAKYFENSPVAELARQNGLTGKAVESRLHRARLKLRSTITTGLRHEA